MFRNYLKIAWRNLVRNKTFSAINIFGLAVGMACALLISLWVRDELSYNRFLPDAPNTYFVRVNYSFRGGETQTAYTTPGPLEGAIASDVPGIVAVTKTNYGWEALLKAVGSGPGETGAKEQGHYATASFFDVFDLPALSGNPKAALAQPDKIIITRRLAEKYFPNQPAVGRQMQLDNAKLYTVGAVLENLPTTSTIQFDWLLNLKNNEGPWMAEWGMNSFMTYVRLKPGPTDEASRVAAIEGSMKGIFPRYAKFDNKETPILQPITDLHLHAEYKNGQVSGGRIEYVRIFSVVALFMLLIACINFINMTTARSAIRTKEVGVRKVVGALRSSLVGLFMIESLLTSLLAVVLALGLVQVILPTVNTLFEKQLALDLTNPSFWGLVVGLVVITGLLSGSYPALFLSGLPPVRMLRGAARRLSPATFRRVLVVFQFGLSMFLIVGMLAIGQQMDYIRTKNLGLDRENVLYVPLEGNLTQARTTATFRQEVLRSPSVSAATITSHLPMDIQNSTTDLNWPGRDPDQLVSVSSMSVGDNFVSTLNIKLLAGRDFRPNSRADSSNYLINEAAARLLGMRSPVGKQITFSNGTGQVVGLMKDFHLNSLHQAISPLVVMFNPANTRYLLVKARAGQTASAIADLKRLTDQFNPGYPFEYRFLDDAYQRLYHAEQQVGMLINYFGILAILISCLGLFGLVTFTAEQRTKEIGVRKVLGASVTSIVTLLSKDFLKLVLIAIVVASPIAWWAMNRWLQDFAYKIDIEWWVFALAGGLAMSVALLTVSFQSVKAALMNPVKSLRSE
ncbi:MAG: ABC transporter permease [Rudanella sp.]|nr:ABC transporter permease [Rudanella sp.]